MIELKEILGKYDFNNLPKDQQDNITILLDRVNKIRMAWGKPMTVTSGYRSMEDHLRIYKDKASKKQKPFENGIFDESKVPKKSKHLFGQAVDISDPNLELTKWLKDNPDTLKDDELWCEEGNSNWVHFQILPPSSGKRWFLP